MGLGSFLKKWGLPIASLAAIPFTGGASAVGLGAGATAASRIGSILGTAGKIAPVLGGMASERGKAKEQGAQDQLSRDTIDQRAADFNLRAPATRLGTGARGVAAGAGPVKINWGGPGSGLRGEQTKVTGGFSAAAGDPRMKQIGDATFDRALSDQLAPPMKGATPAPEASALDHLIGGGADIASILAALGIGKPDTQPNQVFAGADASMDNSNNYGGG